MDIAEIDKLPCAQRFSKRVILKVAEIVDVSVHPGGSFLYVLTLNTNEEEKRQIVSSIVPFSRERFSSAVTDFKFNRSVL